MKNNEVEYFVMGGRRWYTISNFAKYMGVSRTTIYNWLERKDLRIKKNVSMKKIGASRFLTNE